MKSEIQAVVGRNENIVYTKPAPIEITILELCKKWGCTPSEVMNEQFEWVEIAAFYENSLVKRENEIARKQKIEK